MSNAEMNHFCGQLNALASTLVQLTTVTPEWGLNRDASHLANLRDLLKRSERASVTVLVLGPLKAGKSTFMNIIAGSPEVSQVSQLPAYPCYVEVHGLDTNANATPYTVLYRNGEKSETMSPQEAIHTLDLMLRKYVEAGDKPQIEVDHIVQYVNMDGGKRPSELILIDSPGLFFRRKIDDQMSNSERPAESGYSKETLNLYWQSDVAVFVIRPEHLFFEMISEYLHKFSRRAKMRVYLLVNGSQNASNPMLDNGKFRLEPFDQIKNQAAIMQYFNKHAANGELITAMSRGHIVVKFVDLLYASQAVFGNSTAAECQLYPQSETAQALADIEQYVFSDEALMEKKVSLKDLGRTVYEETKHDFSTWEAATRAQQEAAERELTKAEDMLSDCLEKLKEHTATERTLADEEARLLSRIKESTMADRVVFWRRAVDEATGSLKDIKPSTDKRYIIKVVQGESGAWLQDEALSDFQALWDDCCTGTRDGGESLDKCYEKELRILVERILEVLQNSPDADVKIATTQFVSTKKYPTLSAVSPGNFNYRWRYHPWKSSYDLKSVWEPDDRTKVSKDSSMKAKFYQEILRHSWKLLKYFEIEHLVTKAADVCKEHLSGTLPGVLTDRLKQVQSELGKAREILTFSETQRHTLETLRDDRSKAEKTTREQFQELRDRFDKLKALDPKVDELCGGAKVSKETD